MLCFCVSSLLTKATQGPFLTIRAHRRFGHSWKGGDFLPCALNFHIVHIALKSHSSWQAPCVDADHSEEVAQDRGSVCCHCCSRDYQMDAAEFSDWTDFAISVLMLVCVFITLPFQTSLSSSLINRYILNEFLLLLPFFFFPSLAIKTRYVEPSAVLLCFPSVHTVLGFWDFFPECEIILQMGV